MDQSTVANVLSTLNLTSDPVVTLPADNLNSVPQRILGKQSSTAQDIEEFRGIPYGLVPGRWQHSILRTSLPSNPFDATRNGPRCPQRDFANNTGIYQSHLDYPTDVGESEFDCLNLFVVRPTADALVRQGFDHHNGKLPVFVWIHGGGYGFGASTDPPWNPNRLVARSLEFSKPIIAVFLNYRLNCFGFLASPELIDAQGEAPLRGGNFGLGDQYLALQWVSKNISHFGGDPEKITIGGQSAGGSSVHIQTINAKLGHDEPLFRRAAIHSGAVGTLGPIPLSKASANLDLLCKSLDITNTSATERVQLLLKVPATDLLKASEDLGWWIFPVTDDGLTIRPTEGGRWALNLSREQPQPVKDRPGEGPRIDVLVGDADVEGMLWYKQACDLADYDKLEALFKSQLGSVLAEEVTRTYGIKRSSNPVEIRDAVMQLITDNEFGLPVQLAREEFSSTNTSTLQKGWQTRAQSFRFRCGNPWPGPFHKMAQHCIDLIYLFDCFHEDMAKADADALQAGELGHRALVEQVQRLWIDFIADDDDELKYREHQAIVFRQDRSVGVDDMRSDPEWTQRRARLDFLLRNKKALSPLVHQIMEIGVA